MKSNLSINTFINNQRKNEEFPWQSIMNKNLIENFFDENIKM